MLASCSCHFSSPVREQCIWPEFLKHENQPTPASISENDKLHMCQKSQLAEILQEQDTQVWQTLNPLAPDTLPKLFSHNTKAPLLMA